MPRLSNPRGPRVPCHVVADIFKQEKTIQVNHCRNSLRELRHRAEDHAGAHPPERRARSPLPAAQHQPGAGFRGRHAVTWGVRSMRRRHDRRAGRTPVATLPPCRPQTPRRPSGGRQYPTRALAESVQFSIAKNVQFSVAVDTPPQARSADQPRVRGEHDGWPDGAGCRAGSAPRARGTQDPLGIRHACHRISPACAGNTVESAPSRASPSYQPRVRGEHGPLRHAPNDQSGSAPRARGTRAVRRALPCRFRISPACAGNTTPGVRCVRCRSDQPRVRGEHGRSQLGNAGLRISAPRARGTRARGRHQGRRERISPACAGNTVSVTVTPPTKSDQPRVRGEHDAGLITRGMWVGSAPRARGTRGGVEGIGDVPRISPACAGNTSAKEPD